MLGRYRTVISSSSNRHSFGMNPKRGAFPFKYGLIDVARLTLLLLLFFFSPMAISHLQAYTLTVSPTGSGSGTVNSFPAGITCPGDCTGDFSSVTLTANPDSDSIFSGWGGACAGMENCSLTLSADSEVTALFTAKSSTVQVGGSYYGALQKGCDDVAAGGTVEVVAQDQPGDLTLDRGVSLTLKGGYDSGFSSNSGVTEVGGTVTLETGSLTVENIAVGQALSSTPTAAPSNIVATPGSGQVSLTWDTVSSATSYNVYYSTSTGVTRATGTKETSTSSPSLTVTGLSNGTTYYFVVTAVSSYGESVESNQVIVAPQAVPAAPSNVIAVSGNSQATVTWDAVSGATSYNIYYSTSSSVSKTNYTIKITNATSPRIVTSLSNNTPYWFVVTAVNAGGESVESSPAVFAVPTAPAAGFSQDDLTGNWYFIRFATGPDVTSGDEPGWMRGTATVAPTTGSVTINTYSDSLGGSTPPPAAGFDMTMTIDTTGVVTQSGSDALDPGNHAVMAANKQLVVGNGSNGSTPVIIVFVKQGVPGVSFSDSDLSSKDFAFHQLESGDRYEWAYGYGSTNSSRQVTIDSLITPSGPETPSVNTTLYFASPGIMRETANTTSEGVMTPDKKNIFITESNSESACTFRVIQMTGGVTFNQSDLAGIWRSHALVSSTFDSYWEYQTLFIDNSGNAYSIVDTDSYGSTTYSDGTGSAELDESGVMTSDDPESDFHGQVSYNKDMVVITETWDTEEYSLSIVLEQ